jgi:hypothetical protein
LSFTSETVDPGECSMNALNYSILLAKAGNSEWSIHKITLANRAHTVVALFTDSR